MDIKDWPTGSNIVCFGKYRYSQHAAASVNSDRMSLHFAQSQSACINQQSLIPYDAKLNSQKAKYYYVVSNSSPSLQILL